MEGITGKWGIPTFWVFTQRGTDKQGWIFHFTVRGDSKQLHLSRAISEGATKGATKCNAITVLLLDSL